MVTTGTGIPPSFMCCYNIHGGVGEEEERGAGVELFEWEEAQSWMPIAIGRRGKTRSLFITSMPTTRPIRGAASR